MHITVKACESQEAGGPVPSQLADTPGATQMPFTCALEITRRATSCWCNTDSCVHSCAGQWPLMTAPQLALRITLAALCAPGSCPARGVARQHARIAARHTYRGAAVRFAQLPVPCMAGECPVPCVLFLLVSLPAIAVHNDCGATAAWHASAPQSSLFVLRCLHAVSGAAYSGLGCLPSFFFSVVLGSYARASPVSCCCACVLAWQRLTAARLRSAAVLALLSVPLLAAGAPASFAEQADPSGAPMAAPTLA